MRRNRIGGTLVLTLVAGLFANPNMQPKVSAQDINNDLVAHWKFDGSLKEEVMGMNTSNGAKSITYVNGIFGKAAYFNGKDNYLVVDAVEELNLGNSEKDNNDNLTISFWMNPYDLQAKEQMILDKGNESGWDADPDIYYTNPYRVSINGSNNVNLRLSNEYINNKTEYSTTGGETLTGKSTEGQEWKLVTFTYDGKTIKRYEDDQLVTQTKYSDGFTFNKENLYIGINGKDLNEYFKGALDDLRIYKRTLSYSEVEQLYSEGVKANKEFLEPTKQMVAYYSFDGNLKDSTPFKNDGEKVAVGGTTKYVQGKNGKAITMSKGNYIRIPAADQLNFDYDFTVSFWVQSTDSNDQNAPILYRLDPAIGGDNENECAYKVEFGDWGTHTCASTFMDVKGFTHDSWSEYSNTSLSSNIHKDSGKFSSKDWNHITYTYTYDTENAKGLFKVYINGKLRQKTDQFDNPNVVNAVGDLYIGYDNNTFFTGALDELKIYNKCLSATDVAKEYKRVDSISLSKANQKKIATIGKGKSVKCPNLIFKDGDTNKTSTLNISTSGVKISSSNKKVVSVSSKGVIKGVKKGKANITITYGGSSVTYKVTVK